MNVGLYATKIQAEVMKEREGIEGAYDRYPEATLFWAAIDLAGSTNYRIVRGPKDGYVRGETFLVLVAAVVSRSSEIRLVKEIGDEVLLAATSLRQLFESVILVDQITHQMADVAGSPDYPFRIRAALGFGAAKRLTRRHEDYLGSPLDELSRLMKVRSESANLLIHDDAYKPSVDILKEYTAFLSVSEPKMVPAESSKGMLRNVFYREMLVDRARLVEFREHFVPWR